MLECVDLYSGAGGLSLGLRTAGVTMRVAVEADAFCAKTYSLNFGDGSVIHSRIQDVPVKSVLERISNRRRLVVAGGPPCQLFSRLNRNPSNDSAEVMSYIKFVQQLKPMFVVFENVPAILRRAKAWSRVRGGLESLNYRVQFGVVKAVDFGVPQQRERLIVIASRRKVRFPVPLDDVGDVSVRRAIGHYPDVSTEVPNHIALRLSENNLVRISQLSSGELSKPRSESFCDSYSRMHWDRPAPTITTKCISFSNGRFGHPEYNRGITVREAATLQGFPEDFLFCGGLWACARQVGNAVPPPVAKSIGVSLMDAVG